MRSGDSHDRLLERLREEQEGRIGNLARGNTPADNVRGGYMHVAGQVVGLDVAIALVLEILFGERPEEPVNPIARDYGV